MRVLHSSSECCYDIKITNMSGILTKCTWSLDNNIHHPVVTAHPRERDLRAIGHHTEYMNTASSVFQVLQTLIISSPVQPVGTGKLTQQMNT